MSNKNYFREIVEKSYPHGFITDIESDIIAPGLNEEVIRLISEKKNEPDFLLQWRLKAYQQWLTMEPPQWAHLYWGPIDYQAISYYAAPRVYKKVKSLDEIDPKLLETYNKLGIPLHEQQRLA